VLGGLRKQLGGVQLPSPTLSPTAIQTLVLTKLTLWLYWVRWSAQSSAESYGQRGKRNLIVLKVPAASVRCRYLIHLAQRVQWIILCSVQVLTDNVQFARVWFIVPNFDTRGSPLIIRPQRLEYAARSDVWISRKRLLMLLFGMLTLHEAICWRRMRTAGVHQDVVIAVACTLRSNKSPALHILAFPALWPTDFFPAAGRRYVGTGSMDYSVIASNLDIPDMQVYPEWSRPPRLQVLLWPSLCTALLQAFSELLLLGQQCRYSYQKLHPQYPSNFSASVVIHSLIADNIHVSPSTVKMRCVGLCLWLQNHDRSYFILQ